MVRLTEKSTAFGRLSGFAGGNMQLGSLAGLSRWYDP